MRSTGIGITSTDDERWGADVGHFDGIDVHAQYFAEPTGGDMFDAVRVGPRIAFLLCDIAGRRPELDPISAAMRKVFRAGSTTLLGAADMNLMEATETLVHTINQALIEVAKGVRFTPAMVACYDVQLGVLAYINAGGQTALIRDSEGTRALPNLSMPLGLFSHLSYVASMQAFEPGAIMLLVTKGVTKGLASNRLFSPQGLIEVLQRATYRSSDEVCQAVFAAARQVQKRHLEWLPLGKQRVREDMTVLAMIRSA